MSKITVTWFSNNHEHSVQYFKLGFMRLAGRGEIKFQEIPNHLGSGLLPEFMVKHDHRRTAVVEIRQDNHRRLIILDGEDSVFQTSPLIEHCDLYFVCAFNRRFFEGAPFDLALPWQDESETAHYKTLYGTLQEKYRAHLGKGRASVPIGPGLSFTPSDPWLTQRIHRLKHRARKAFTRSIDWGLQYERFEMRWQYLTKLREVPAKADVVLKDSLWGWPRHRIALHRKLAEVSPRYAIHSELTWRKTESYELGNHPQPEPSAFPMKSGGGVQGNYEEMLAASRLGVFATGFHWGCRNIITLAWFLGLPVYMDPPSFESIYNFESLGALYNRKGDWNELETHLKRISQADHAAMKKANQKTFDQVASPERAASHVLSTALGGQTKAA